MRKPYVIKAYFQTWFGIIETTLGENNNWYIAINNAARFETKEAAKKFITKNIFRIKKSDAGYRKSRAIKLVSVFIHGPKGGRYAFNMR